MFKFFDIFRSPFFTRGAVAAGATAFMSESGTFLCYVVHISHSVRLFWMRFVRASVRVRV